MCVQNSVVQYFHVFLLNRVVLLASFRLLKCLQRYK